MKISRPRPSAAVAVVLALGMGLFPPNLAGQTYQIVPTYKSGVTTEYKTAIGYAVGLWNSWIANAASGGTGTLEVNFRFSNMGSYVLGSSGPEWLGVSGGLALLPAQYMIATGSDLRRVDGEIELNSNSSVSWYSGTDGNTGAGQYDLVSVTLHEIAHQMGIFDSYVEGAGFGFQGTVSGLWYLTRWDTFLRDQNGNAPQPRHIGGSFDATGTVSFEGPQAQLAYGGPVPVYAPDPFQAGSSLSHFDPILLSPDPLMSPWISSGVARHGLFDYEVGAFKDLGWDLRTTTAHAKVAGTLWHDGNSWREGLPPSSTTDVYLDAASPAAYTIAISKPAQANNVYVSGNGILRIDSGGNLAAAELHVGGSGGGTLSLNSPNATITVSGELRFAAGSTVTAVAGAAIHITTAVLENESTDPTALSGLANVMLVVEGGQSVINDLEVAGTDLGKDLAGWADNFVLGCLQLGGYNVGRIRLVDTFDNQQDGPANEALYVNHLILNSGAFIELNGFNLFYLNGGGPKLFILGDADLNGAITDADYTIWADNYSPGGSGATWAMGDFNGDGQVSDADYTIWADNYSSPTIPTPTTPECASLSLLVVGSLTLIRPRRNARRV